MALRWWQVAPILKRATDRSGGTYQPIDVLKEVFAGQIGLWLIEDENEDLIAVGTARVRQFPQKRVVHIEFIAGKRLDDWWALFLEEMDKLARDANATEIYALGRAGWVRFLQSRGAMQHIASEILVRGVMPR